MTTNHIGTNPSGMRQSVQPILPGGEGKYVQTQIQALKDSLDSTRSFTPQQALKVPATVVDGVIRLARWPWWPVPGQTADAWVYFDGIGNVWRYMATAPTSSH